MVSGPIECWILRRFRHAPRLEQFHDVPDRDLLPPAMTKRNRLAFALACLVMAAIPASAQQVPREVRIGFLSSNPMNADSLRWLDALRQGLRERGWKEGQNVILDPRWGDGQYDHLDSLADELVGLGVDAIVTDSTPSALAAKRATRTIPIVLGLAGDPVGSGLVASLVRPGGNVTGMSLMSPELNGKRFELLKELVPAVRRVAVIRRADNPVHEIFLKEAQDSARRFGLKLRVFDVQTTADLDGALPAVAAWKAQAIFVFGDVLLESAPYSRRIIDFAVQQKIPTIGVTRELAEVGILMSFGASYAAMFHQAAVVLDKILRGASPAGLPIEQPTKFELVVNLKTAKALGITIPQSILIRADEVIR